MFPLRHDAISENTVRHTEQWYHIKNLRRKNTKESWESRGRKRKDRVRGTSALSVMLFYFKKYKIWQNVNFC